MLVLYLLIISMSSTNFMMHKGIWGQTWKLETNSGWTSPPALLTLRKWKNFPFFRNFTLF
ncbi:hypothetical protein BXT86_04195 [candidate division WOR-3 bacterium 4484_100]|uniref:Uncharacterized protein n=1 Tax=candidate division WOR-3 bacterium 4484_100 TaxID=1936077 RepID=A0A1V4QET8_UNCW3|nr:MAG: hypothetical protein BXT86_04195 [candidate division WOR-3 bacterium 4484_100]